jgi:hypothetical protein
MIIATIKAKVRLTITVWLITQKNIVSDRDDLNKYASYPHVSLNRFIPENILT